MIDDFRAKLPSACVLDQNNQEQGAHPRARAADLSAAAVTPVSEGPSRTRTAASLGLTPALVSERHCDRSAACCVTVDCLLLVRTNQ